MFSTIFESVRTRLRARADEEALSNPSDAALDDIGLIRGAVSGLRAASESARPEAVAVMPLLAPLAFPTAIQSV